MRIYLHCSLLAIIIFGAIEHSTAQKGLFLKFSIEPGWTVGYNGIKASGLSLATKNHAVGWGINEKFAIYVGEFGGLVKESFNGYKFINVDVFGLGCSYRPSPSWRLNLLGGWSRVAFARKWSEPSGENADHGRGFSLALDREWDVGRRWGFCLGPQLYWVHTKEEKYSIVTSSINGSVIFYLSPKH